jgi:hypothetical protein
MHSILCLLQRPNFKYLILLTLIFKVSKQVPLSYQAELDHVGSSYSSNLKFLNPSPDGTGALIASHLQSVTKKLAVGLEYVYTKRAPGDTEGTLTLL